MQSKEPKYYDKPRIVLNHRSRQICDLSIFQRTLILGMQINAYLHPNVLYLQGTKRDPEQNQSYRGLVFPNNVYVAKHSSTELFLRNCCTLLHKMFCAAKY